MKRKIPVIVVIISCLLSQFVITEGNASIRPVITTTMPDKMTIGLQEVTLHWYIIDDNLNNYAIYINNSLWKNDSISSNVLEVQFSNSVGSYNITLEVTDFSHNSASYQMIIIVTQSSQTTSTSNNTSLTSTTSYPTSYASPGFGLVEVLGFLMFVAVVVNLNNKKKR